MTYSYVFQKTYIENNTTLAFSGLKKIIDNPSITNAINFLNNLKGIDGFVFKNFSLEGSKNSNFQRNYFSTENAQKIDAIREQIEEWKSDGIITELEYYILLCAILEAIPFVSNIAGTFGAFLKIDDPRKYKHFVINAPELIKSKLNHKCHLMDSNELIKKIKCDVLYLDPPYNTRQYPANYHMLETIAVWDKKLLDSKTGLRPWAHQKSLYCSKSQCVSIFEDLIKNANCKYVLFSYNSEGLIPYDEISRILSKKGKLTTFKQEYRRFKSNSRDKKVDKNVYELLFFVKVS